MCSYLVKPVGCDKKLDSGVYLDKCRVCGGNSTTCEPIIGRIERSKTQFEKMSGKSKNKCVECKCYMFLVGKEVASKELLLHQSKAIYGNIRFLSLKKLTQQIRIVNNTELFIA